MLIALDKETSIHQPLKLLICWPLISVLFSLPILDLLCARTVAKLSNYLLTPTKIISPLLSKALHTGYINMTCRVLLLTRHCLCSCSFFLVLQTVHSFVCTLYLFFLVLVINSTMGEFCCLNYFLDSLFCFCLVLCACLLSLIFFLLRP